MSRNEVYAILPTSKPVVTCQPDHSEPADTATHSSCYCQHEHGGESVADVGAGQGNVQHVSVGTGG